MTKYEELLPVNIVTGFLGSGKTTLLKHLLSFEEMSDTAVLINEFGEIGLDHHLLERIDGNTVMLKSGCICCTIRDDLSVSLQELWDRKATGELSFRRIVLETTGLADPSPIIHTLMAGEVVKHHFRISNIVTTIDAVNAPGQQKKHLESLKQIAVADRIIFTKSDLSDVHLTELIDTASMLNPAAGTYTGYDQLTPRNLFTKDMYDLRSKSNEVQQWIAAEDLRSKQSHEHDRSRHDMNIRSFYLSLDSPINWTAFGLWLTLLLHTYGQDILRVKAILHISELDGPVAIHGVQHVLVQD